MASHSFHTVGFIGLGVMGEPMCANLHAKSGCTVLAFDADPATLARAREAGMTVAEELRELAEHAEVIFTSLPGGPELTAVVEELLPHLWHGQIFVDTSTAPVTRTRELATRLAEEGVVYLDAPIARTRQAAREGTLATMVGGPAEAFERVHALLACYASDIIHCGAVGCGQIVKLMNNMVLVETVNALSEALTIARRAGMDG
ncbi:MAG TPA: NAD(P)-dependent oxidoreductase, partial [Alphaproteobacteria bacterium]|nr:NAD(P)-dependent oxidoreductase [Alphaproteobacteria bacterium]